MSQPAEIPAAEIRVVAAAIVRDGRLLAALRGPDMKHAGLWELPGGKVEAGEADRDALVREIREELAVEIGVGALLGESVHDYGAVRVRLVAYVAHLDRGEPRALEHAELRWLDADSLESVPWVAADRPLLGPARALLGETPGGSSAKARP